MIRTLPAAGVHRAIYARRLVFIGKTEMHIDPTLCVLIRISDTKNQKRVKHKKVGAPSRAVHRGVH